ncbi:thymus-specific serine protease [Corythoichthys intestinalis]|uniref:thymus-specific serine protease n=1 Tax=Corythoichthys intestinalis TaxID=161448 RepID=UPI0025A63492|nr:thymus-specific serine protease [Corythoichthys intestinalis]XP_061797403.1 putative serine protease K12H4.7 [Nerophis lumbriciformis]
MGFPTHGFVVCKFTFLFAFLVAGEGRLKGFGRFNEIHRHASDEQWFMQKLDHFNGADDRMWKQRYFVNDAFYKPGGPVFLMIGGEGPANPAWMQHGTWLTYAEKLGAICFMLEHRFYGKSHPTVDLSTENLRYLSSRQALADLAHFRTVIAETQGLANMKWVAFGGSYPGSLAAWFRLKYPHLVHASAATSAPIHATVNFPEYLEVVGRSLASEDTQCPLLVKKASDTLIERLKDPSTYDNITKDFNLCSKLQIQTETDSAYFLEILAGNFMDVVQYNEDNRGFEGIVGTNITIKVLCAVMADTSLGDPYARYVAVAQLMMDTFSMKCLDASFNNNLRDMTNTSWEGPAAEGGRQWVYQTCTEFGFYQSTDSPNQPFAGFPLEYHVKQCADYYNVSAEQLAKAVAETNEYYGSYDIHSTRIIFPNGSIDPWHALGITQDIKAELPAVFIKGTAHCANMYPASSEDLLQLTLARDQIFLHLQQWLKQ